jgi:hypothetical protein
MALVSLRLSGDGDISGEIVSEMGVWPTASQVLSSSISYEYRASGFDPNQRRGPVRG